MDKFDKIILAELSEDCRKPLTDISKKIKRSPQFVKYRLDNLKQDHIKDVPILVDYYSQGKNEVTFLAKFSEINPLNEKIFIDKLLKKVNAYKLFYSPSSYNIICSFIVESLEEAQKIKEELLDTSRVEGKHLVNYSSTFCPLNYLSEKYSENTVTISQDNEKREEDISPILKELQKNPFSSTLEISRKVEEPYETVRTKLKKTEVIKGNTLVLRQKDVQRSIVLFKIKDKQTFHLITKSHRNVTEINYTVGDHDAYIILESLENHETMRKNLTYSLRDSITDFQALNITKFYKYGWYGL